MSREDIKVRVSVQHRGSRSNSNGADKAVNDFTNRLALPAALAVKRRRTVIVRWKRRQMLRSRQQALKFFGVLFAARAYQDFHPYGITNGQFIADQPGANRKTDG